MNARLQVVRVFSVLCLIAGVIVAVTAKPSNAAVTDSVPNQPLCTYGTGSAPPLWGDPSYTGPHEIGPSFQRPVVASMTINGESVPSGEITTPQLHHIGVAICAGFQNARKVGLNIIQRSGSVNYQSDLTGALTPSGAAYSPSMSITLTLTNLGSNAQYYSYSIVHGNVTSWTTTGLGTSSAGLTFSLKPVRIPLVDSNDAGAGLCSATPPICSAQQSRLDITGANVYMDMDPDNPATDFNGAYFAVDGAVAGFVTKSQQVNDDGSHSITATLGGAHFRADGTTPNIGSMQAYLPNATLANLLELDTTGLDANDLDVSRTDSSDPGDAPFTLTRVTGGAVVNVSNISFSTPVYSISNALSSSGGTGGQSGGGGGNGYRLFSADGGVFNYGGLNSYGNPTTLHLDKPIVTGKSTHDSEGYWMAGADGGVFAYGDAGYYGSPNTLHLNKSIVGFAPNPQDEEGYWLAAADGGVFAYGDCVFLGSAGSLNLNKPIVGFAPTRAADGYYMVASDGGVFAYGGAKFLGSLGGTHLNSPIVGISVTQSGNGYWLVAADGGVFAYGDAQFHGSLGGTHLASPVVGIQGDPSGSGYVLVAADGGVFAYGSSNFLGSAAGVKLAKPIVAIG